jgi:hypothetical protein
MTTQRILSMAALMGLVACADKGGDTAGEGGEDGGVDGGGDGGGSDTASDGGSGSDTGGSDGEDGGGGSSYLETTTLFVLGDFAVRDATMTTVDFGDGVETAPYLYFWLIEDDWEGFEDVDNACLVIFDLTGAAEISADMVSAGSWLGWDIDLSLAVPQMTPSCDDLNPDTEYGGDVVTWLGSYSWSIGVGAAGDELVTSLEDLYAEDYDDYADNFFGSPLGTDYGGGEFEITPDFNYGVAFETDDEGVIVTDEDGNGSFVDVSEATEAPDGYYRLFPYYGFYLP